MESHKFSKKELISLSHTQTYTPTQLIKPIDEGGQCRDVVLYISNK
jgi:hypothetical protein